MTRTQSTLPAEWHDQFAVVAVWPDHSQPWDDQWPALVGLYQRLCAEISAREILILCFNNSSKPFEFIEENNPNIQCLEFANNDIWARDFAPLTLLDTRQRVLMDFHFNGWGNKYPSLRDARFGAALLQSGLLRQSIRKTHPMVWEGGNLESNGEGIALAGWPSARTRLFPFGLVRDEIAAILADSLGLQQLLWIDNGELIGDDTDGHLDNLVRFAPGNRLLYTCCAETDREQHALLAPLERELRTLRIREAAPELFPLPLPRPILNREGRRLPASYANFLIINDAVLAPVFNDPEDQTALSALAQCFPGRAIIPIESRPLIEQFGGIHCATMQIPSTPADTPIP